MKCKHCGKDKADHKYFFGRIVCNTVTLFEEAEEPGYVDVEPLLLDGYYSVNCKGCLINLSSAINHEHFMGYVWCDGHEDYITMDHTYLYGDRVERCKAVRFRKDKS